MGLRGFQSHLAGATSYLHRVAKRELPYNQAIIDQIQVSVNQFDLIDVSNLGNAESAAGCHGSRTGGYPEHNGQRSSNVHARPIER